MPYIKKIFDETILPLNYGHLRFATNVMKNAYLNAQKLNENTQKLKFLQKAFNLFDINFGLIIVKFIFSDILFPKFQFYELVKRYAGEHPEEKHFFCLENTFLSSYDEELRNYGKVEKTISFNYFYFFITILFSPLYLFLIWRLTGNKDKFVVQNTIICNVSAEKELLMYKDLFSERQGVKYVTVKEYAGEFPLSKIEDGSIHLLNYLSLEDYIFFKKCVYKFISVCLLSIQEVGIYGSAMFNLFRKVVLGRVITPGGKGNTFFTFEHYFSHRSVRNEFIRSEGSQSVFFSMYLYTFSRYCHLETFQNYDILCSSGKHLEELYKAGLSLTSKFLRTGSYVLNKGVVDIDGYHERLQKLIRFKEDCAVITFLMCGVCDETYSVEVRLMELALKVAEQEGVKVFIRLKPVDLSKKEEKFYTDFLQISSSIMLTGKEYELFDFIEVTDLFVTNISSTPCEFAVRGGQVLYVNFFKTPDRFYFWEVIPDVQVDGEEAYEKIIAWILDEENGKIRSNHRKLMNKLVKYICYKFPDFETYKLNFTSVLNDKILN